MAAADHLNFNPNTKQHMKYFLAQLFAALFIAITVHSQPATSPDADAAKAIGELRDGLVGSFNSGDIDRLLTFLDTNAVVTWQNGEVCEGPSAVKAYYERMMKGDKPIVSKVTADPKILGRHVQGEWAVSWGNLNDLFVLTDGRELALDSRFTATLVRRGDHWRVSAFHVSVNAFENSVMTLAIKKVSLLTGGAGALAGLFFGVLGMWALQRARTSATR